MEIAVMVIGKKKDIFFFIEFESVWSGKAWGCRKPQLGWLLHQPLNTLQISFLRLIDTEIRQMVARGKGVGLKRLRD